MKKAFFALLLVFFVTSCEDISNKSNTKTVTSTEKVTSLSDEQSETTTISTGETAETTTTFEEVTTAEEIGDYQVVGENGILVYKRNNHYMGIMPCWGTLEFCDGYISSLNDFAKLLPDVDVYSMVIPTSAEFYLPAGWESFSASQKSKIDYIDGKLINVTSVDAHSALLEHRNEEIYSRTDHHWFPLGAYYAAEKFAEAASFEHTPLDEYEKVIKDGYVGSLYSYSKDNNLLNDPEDFTMYIPKRNLETTYYNTSFKNGTSGELFVSKDASSYYCSFLGTDQIIAKIETENNTGRILVVFKESYGNALIPFITDGFDTIYVCDIRYFDLNAVQFCKDVNATDLLFSTCTFTPAGVNCKYFDIIKTKAVS